MYAYWMKARELIDILHRHPDWEVAFKDVHYGGVDEYIEREHIEERQPDASARPAQVACFLITPPLQSEEPD